MSLPTPPWTSPEAQAALADDSAVFPHARPGATLPDAGNLSFLGTALRLARERPLLVGGWLLAVLALLVATLLVGGCPSSPTVRRIVFMLGDVLLILAGVIYIARRKRLDGLNTWARARGFTAGGHVDDASVPLMRLSRGISTSIGTRGLLGPYESVVGSVHTGNRIDGADMVSQLTNAVQAGGTTWTVVRIKLPAHVSVSFNGISLTERAHSGPDLVDLTWSEYAVGGELLAPYYRLHASIRQDAANLPFLFTEDFAQVLAGTRGALQWQQHGGDLLVFQRGAGTPETYDALCRAALLVALQFDEAASNAAPGTAAGIAPAAQGPVATTMAASTQQPASTDTFAAPPPPPAVTPASAADGSDGDDQLPASYTHNAA